MTSFGAALYCGNDISNLTDEVVSKFQTRQLKSVKNIKSGLLEEVIFNYIQHALQLTEQ